MKTPSEKRGNPHIYILKDSANCALKIGYTADLQQRLRQHSTANPFLKLVVVFPVKGQLTESNLHKSLLLWRVPGTAEWYFDKQSLRDKLQSFLDYEGIAVKPNWESVSNQQPGSDTLSVTIQLPQLYLNLLVVSAWINGKSIAKQASNDLVNILESQQNFCDNAIAIYSRHLKITKKELISKILKGQIEPNITCKNFTRSKDDRL